MKNHYSHYSDIELVSLLQSGNKAAFEKIYERYALLLYRYAYSRIRSKEDSEEIIQEIFLWLWQKRETLAHVNPLKPYLYTAVRHKIANHIARGTLRDKYAEHYALFSTRYDNSADELTDISDFHSVLEKSIAGLPKNCQIAFRLSRIEHLPIAHIAERMNLSTGTIENYISQALKQLRNVWGNHYRGE